MGTILDKNAVLDRVKQFYKLKGNADLARFLGVSPNTVTNWYSRNSFDIDAIYTYCVDCDFHWLLTGRGSMLRNSKNPEEKTVGTPNATPVSPAEESVIYKMYEKKDEESRTLIRENGRLEERLRSMEQELSAFKSKHELHPEPLKRAPKSSDPAKPAFTKQPSSPNADNVTSAIVP